MCASIVACLSRPSSAERRARSATGCEKRKEPIRLATGHKIPAERHNDSSLSQEMESRKQSLPEFAMKRRDFLASMAPASVYLVADSQSTFGVLLSRNARQRDGGASPAQQGSWPRPMVLPIPAFTAGVHQPCVDLDGKWEINAAAADQFWDDQFPALSKRGQTPFVQPHLNIAVPHALEINHRRSDVVMSHPLLQCADVDAVL
jgi:hypothetical protein